MHKCIGKLLDLINPLKPDFIYSNEKKSLIFLPLRG